MKKQSSLLVFLIALLGNVTMAQLNTFYGTNAGNGSVTGNSNSAFGNNAGRAMTTANGNTLIGSSTGSSLSLGGANTFVGTSVGTVVSTGAYNTLMGYQTGLNMTVNSSHNTVIGNSAGALINGNENALFGSLAGRYISATGLTSLVNGNGLTLLGYRTSASEGLTNASAIGYQAQVTANNALILGNTAVNVGIGVTAPSAKLELNSTTAGVSSLKFTQLTANTTAGVANGKALSVDASGNVILVPAGQVSGASYWNLNTTNNNITNSNTGCVVIGTTITKFPTGYKLFVEGGIMTERLKVAVKNAANWADYVFADTYRLRPLNEVAQHIAQYKHLPDVPSAQEVVNNGLDLAENQAKLLQKIEELTLYVIEQDKQIKQLQKTVKHLKK